VRVHHRNREVGQSKYGVLNRLWVGIVDIRGVRWLQSRAAVPGVDEIVPQASEGNAPRPS
jgi:dolichol-phosphate mannosyltransferase